MTYALSANERRMVSNLSADDRYDYFIAKAVENGELWSLNSEGGWVEVTSDDGEQCFPVWPHPDLAAEWVTGDWSDCTPTAIPLAEWVERWTPGLESDGAMLAVFPRSDEGGVVVTPDELLESMDLLTGE